MISSTVWPQRSTAGSSRVRRSVICLPPMARRESTEFHRAKRRRCAQGRSATAQLRWASRSWSSSTTTTAWLSTACLCAATSPARSASTSPRSSSRSPTASGSLAEEPTRPTTARWDLLPWTRPRMRATVGSTLSWRMRATHPGVRGVCMAGSPDATHGVDVTGHLDAAVASLQAHQIYLGRLGADYPSPPDLLELILGRGGQSMGVEHAITFEVYDI